MSPPCRGTAQVAAAEGALLAQNNKNQEIRIRHRETQKFSRKPMQNCKHTLFDVYSLLVLVFLVVLLCF